MKIYPIINATPGRINLLKLQTTISFSRLDFLIMFFNRVLRNNWNMKRLNVLVILLFSILSLMAQDRLSVFIGNANRYASVDLVGYRKRLCKDYRMSSRDLDYYYRMCGRNWGNVGIALEIAHSTGRHMRDVCRYYNKYG